MSQQHGGPLLGAIEADKDTSKRISLVISHSCKTNIITLSGVKNKGSKFNEPADTINLLDSTRYFLHNEEYG